jgi:hypothetical protein
MDVPSMAQTHMQGPLSVTTGSGKPLTKEELDAVKKELEEIKHNYNLKEPERSSAQLYGRSKHQVPFRWGSGLLFG